MIWIVLTLVAVLVIVVIRGIVSGRVRFDQLPPALSSAAAHGLPQRPTGADVASLTLETAPVGYHAEQVDDTLDALEARLREQEEELRAWLSP